MNIHEVLTRARQLAENGFGRHVRMIENYDPSLPEVLGDRDQLVQVFLNLVMNAIHAVGGNGTIAISTNFDADRQVVSAEVADDGYGIRQKDLSRIFDPFFTTKPTGQGTGLGLSVSYGIIKKYQGTITVENIAGAGCQFIIMLPLE